MDLMRDQVVIGRGRLLQGAKRRNKRQRTDECGQWEVPTWDGRSFLGPAARLDRDDHSRARGASCDSGPPGRSHERYAVRRAPYRCAKGLERVLADSRQPVAGSRTESQSCPK